MSRRRHFPAVSAGCFHGTPGMDTAILQLLAARLAEEFLCGIGFDQQLPAIHDKRFMLSHDKMERRIAEQQELRDSFQLVNIDVRRRGLDELLPRFQKCASDGMSP